MGDRGNDIIVEAIANVLSTVATLERKLFHTIGQTGKVKHIGTIYSKYDFHRLPATFMKSPLSCLALNNYSIKTPESFYKNVPNSYADQSKINDVL